MKIKLKKHWLTGESAVQKFNTAFFETLSTNSRSLPTTGSKRYKIYSEKSILLWRTTEKVTNTNFNVLGSHWPQEAAS
ncbi:unnamed protein product [Schistosoma margrebowiei]|uniref:Uncharacterized protein n=1 Tax=Schistosoma margrebowiei TaxID=48269 RepID=A0A183LCY6_9TREM|nr:unnamed protein product [Schistosoma margrebowiei]